MKDIKQFNKALENWKKNAVSVRDESDVLAKTAIGFILSDYNAAPLSQLFMAMHEVKGFDLTNFTKWVFFVTGGDTGLTKNGVPVVDPDKSWLEWNNKTSSFNLKTGANIDKELTAYLANDWAWYAFCPKSKPSVYSFTKLIQAIKNADKNRSTIPARDREALDGCIKVLVEHGYHEAIIQ